MRHFIRCSDPNIHVVFSKVLRKSDIEHQLTVPTEILKEYPIFAGNWRGFTCLDRNGYSWEFRLAIRRPPQYAKPCIQSSMWHRFVVAKRLCLGDAVVFYTMIDNPAAGRQVRCLRQESGTKNWLDVELFP